MAEEKRLIIHPAGDVIDFEAVFEYDPSIAGEPWRRGHFGRIEYTTDVYDDGISHPNDVTAMTEQVNNPARFKESDEACPVG